MAKNFNELRGKMSPERQRRNKAEADRALLEMTLQELRQNVVPSGELSLPSHAGTDEFGVQYFDVLAVRSDIGETKRTSDAFSVEIPDTPADLDSDEPAAPIRARVEVDSALPADFTGSPFALFRGWLCTYADVRGCQIGNGMSRAIPVR